ncbi:MAG: CBS domain-containing protein [Gemmatimonadales bacterium]|nr:CBS domain-containing protein [Gemmatimonadales bacterium]
MHVRDILRRKGSDVFTSHGAITVHEVARIMTNRGIGSVLIVEQGELLGIMTERDVLRRVVAQAKDPGVTPIAEVMTRAPLFTVTPDTTLDECRQLFSSRRIRHIPVLDAQGALAGVVTSGDLLAAQLADKEATIEQLTAFVYDNR